MTRVAILPQWLVLVGFFNLAGFAQATLVSSWTQDQGSAVISGQSTTTVTIGNGGNNSASGVSVSGSLSGTVTASSVGDSIQMLGTLTLTGISNNNVSGLSFGLYDTNGSSNANGWLGYSVSNSDGSNTGQLMERNAGNSTIYTSTTGETQLATTLASSSPAFTDGTYSFSITLTRQAANAYAIVYSLNRTSSAGYTMTGSFTDTTASTFSINRIGFLAGSNLKADQFSISLTDVSITVIPEPSAAGLCIPGAFLLGRSRVRRKFAAAGLSLE